MYDITAKSYKVLYKEEQERKAFIAYKHLKPNKNDLLLDVGCGCGFSSTNYVKKIGIDPSFELVKDFPGKKICGNAENLPFKDNSFDIVICITAIHHTQIDKALSEIKRVGKQRFAISVLKKSLKKDFLMQKIKHNFKHYKEIEEDKDIIFIIH